MITSKEQNIIEALIEDELNTAKEVVINSNTADLIILVKIGAMLRGATLKDKIFAII